MSCTALSGIKLLPYFDHYASAAALKHPRIRTLEGA